MSLFYITVALLFTTTFLLYRCLLGPFSAKLRKNALKRNFGYFSSLARFVSNKRIDFCSHFYANFISIFIAIFKTFCIELKKFCSLLSFPFFCFSFLCQFYFNFLCYFQNNLHLVCKVLDTNDTLGFSFYLSIKVTNYVLNLSIQNSIVLMLGDFKNSSKMNEKYK